MRAIAIILTLLAALAFVLSHWLSRPVVSGELTSQQFSSLTIAPLVKAITLARDASGTILLATDADARGITAIDVSTYFGGSYQDAVDVYQQLGSWALRDAVADAPKVVRDWQDLTQPIDSSYPHIAAGTNYRAHAEEVGHDGEPFLFPKLSHSSAWNADVLTGTRLDYEVELCAVPLADFGGQAPAKLGYLLCGDFTDRWLLVRDIDTDAPMGPTGFPLAKGGESRLPIGPLLLIPSDDEFYRDIELSLYVNETLRQQAPAGQMIWSPQQIVVNALDNCGTPYYRGEQTLSLTACESVPAATLVLTGTPEGVLFNLATIWNPWAYLRNGDVVTSFGTYLGYLRNTVRDPGY